LREASGVTDFSEITGGRLHIDHRRVVAYIKLDALEDNYALIRSRIPAAVKLLCVVKADAYGHGVLPVARLMESLGTDYLGVATMSEGVFLREKGIRLPVLVMGGCLPWEDIGEAAAKSLTVAVHDPAMIERIGCAALEGTAPLRVHVKVDTGMGRLGFLPGQLPTVFEALRMMEGVLVEGMMSHFASSEVRDAYGFAQIEKFRQALDIAEAEGPRPSVAHIANSGAVTVYPEALFNMVRVGINLYGSHPDRALAGLLPVRQVMTVTSRIASIRHFDGGAALSYGRTFVTDGSTMVAYVPVGYADGYPRYLSNRGVVLIRGERCPVVGRVCMDWLLVNVSHLRSVEVGDEVVLLGGEGPAVVTADELAEKAGTIPYEILCKISARVPRVYA
jgi:alanine racemase